MLEKEIWSSCFYKKRLRGLHENISDILTMELVLRQNCNLFWVSNHIFLQVRREWLFQPPCGNCFLNFWPKDTDQVHIHLLEFSGTLKWNTDKTSLALTIQQFTTQFYKFKILQSSRIIVLTKEKKQTNSLLIVEKLALDSVSGIGKSWNHVVGLLIIVES